MLKIKCAYYTKLFIITILAVTLLTMVEIAPEFPILFIAATLTMIISIRLLWISALKDEYKLTAVTLAIHHPRRRIRKNPRKAA